MDHSFAAEDDKRLGILANYFLFDHYAVGLCWYNTQAVYA